jgi:RNA-directed DNA polymerase
MAMQAQNMHSYPACALQHFMKRATGSDSCRSAHDAQKVLFNNLSSRCNGINKRVIELDIEKCFDRISHITIMDNLIAPSGIKSGIFRCLKAGINPEFPKQGTPQGGVVSPLLANIALNGIESIHKYKNSSVLVEPSIRYADDMVIILRPEDDATKILGHISQFLTERGMKVSEKKTKITAATDGFDFLGWVRPVLALGKAKTLEIASLEATLENYLNHVG